VYKDIVIVDLDGTLSDPEHRRHYLKGPKKNWNRFLDLAVDDPVKEFTKRVVVALTEKDNEIHILSGRHKKYLQASEWWLKHHKIPYDYIDLPRGESNSHIKDSILKSEWLDSKGKSFEDRIACCIDDRDQVVEMWRSRGLVCWQVAEGNF